MKTPRPKHLYRLATREEWRAAKRTGEVAYTERDQRDGRFNLSAPGAFLSHCWFIHRDRKDIFALEIPFEDIGHDVLWRESGATYPDGTHPLRPYLRTPLATRLVSDFKLLKPGHDGRFIIDLDFIRHKMMWEAGA